MALDVVGESGTLRERVAVLISGDTRVRILQIGEIVEGGLESRRVRFFEDGLGAARDYSQQQCVETMSEIEQR